MAQYRIYYSSIEKVAARRISANSFFLSITTSIAGVVGYGKTSEMENSSFLLFSLSVSGHLICYYWIKLLDNYKNLNSGKFQVLIDIEKLLPLNLFNCEWEVLKTKKYESQSIVEKSIPLIFSFIFTIIILTEAYSLYYL